MAQRFWPLARGHMITSGYGPRWGAMHYGLDFGWPGGSAGQPVYAVQAGTVVQVGWDPGGFGWFLDVDSDDSQGSNLWVYGHIKPEVTLGDRVAAGQRIAHVNGDRGTNGGVDPHCHVEVHQWTRQPAGPGRMDPAPFLQGAAFPGETPAPLEEDASVTQFGVDISNWQQGLDIAAVAREDFRAIIAKVSEGSGYRDPTWPGFRDAARAAGLPVMGYHYLQSSDSVEDQADLFVQHLGDPGIPAMIDAEIGSGGVGTIRAFRDAIERRGVRVALLYLPRWYWQGHIGAPDLTGLPPLMASSYGTDRPGYASSLYPGDHDPAWNGYGGLDVAVLQFTQRAQVAGKQIDAWAYRGTSDQLAALFGAATPGGFLMALSDAEQRELYEAICKREPSLVEEEFLDGQPRGEFNSPTYSRTADYHAFHAHRLAAQAAADVAALKAKLGVQ